MKYLAGIDGEMFARTLQFTSAMTKFSRFMDLPESSSKLKALFDAAFTVVALIQPELFLVKFLGEEARAVELALTIAEATGSKTAKAIKVVGKIREGAEKVKGLKEKVEAHQEKEEKKRAAPEAGEKLKQLDAGKKPVQEMIAAYQKAQGIWSKALDALDKELENRLDSKAAPAKESLEAMAKRLLKLPQPLSSDELEQLETLFLWHLTSAWAKSNVTLVVMPPGYGDRLDFKGINDTQVDTLSDWFGFGAKRGRFFSEPPTWFMSMTLSRMGAKKIEWKPPTIPRAA